jgi:hypothetical protein
MKTVTRRRRGRGAAAVETAILCVVLVPIMMYSMFLSDLCAYKLEQDEAVFGSTWDFAGPVDYRHQKSSTIFGSKDDDHLNEKCSKTGRCGLVEWSERCVYADHNSAFNEVKDNVCDSSEHHQALAAHQCWLTPKGQQIQCHLDESSTGGLINPLFLDKNNGGLVSCRARLGVMNYFLPQKFMSWWAHEDMYSRNHYTDGTRNYVNVTTDIVHRDAPSETFHFPVENMALVVDPWALNWVRTGDENDFNKGHLDDKLSGTSHPGNSDSEMTKWAWVAYAPAYFLKSFTIENFGIQAISKGFLNPLVMLDRTGDAISTIPIAWKVNPETEVQAHDHSGWNDSRVQNTRSAMTDSYMGVAESTFAP